MSKTAPVNIFGINRARAAAKSTTFNPRNLEYVWYPFWTRAASRLASEVDSQRLTVAPQFPLWRIWTRDDAQLGEITLLSKGYHVMDDSDEYRAAAPDSMQDEDDSYDDNNYDDDSTDDSGTISTTNETLNIRTRSRITDFALIHWLENDSVNPDKKDEEDEEFHIHREFIAALFEIKRASSRQLVGQDLLRDEKNKMLDAQKGVFIQALYLFSNDKWSHQKNVLVIAAVGDKWTYTTISRQGSWNRPMREDEMDPEWKPDDSEFAALEWSEVSVWGRTGEGAVKVECVRRWLAEHCLKQEGGGGSER